MMLSRIPLPQTKMGRENPRLWAVYKRSRQRDQELLVFDFYALWFWQRIFNATRRLFHHFTDQ
jgi:hypothetical protein